MGIRTSFKTLQGEKMLSFSPITNKPQIEQLTSNPQINLLQSGIVSIISRSYFGIFIVKNPVFHSYEYNFALIL